MADETPTTVTNHGVETVKDTPIRGKDVWYFLQATSAPVGSKAVLPAHQTAGDTSYEGDSLDEQTKMGRILAPSTNEDSIEITQYIVPGDKAYQMIKDAKHKGQQVKVWRVTVDPRLAKASTNANEKLYPAEFGYAIVDSADVSDEDGFSELDGSLNIIGKLVDGWFPLTDDQVALLSELYDYENPGEKTGEFGSDSAAETDDSGDDGKTGTPDAGTSDTAAAGTQA